jgi:hypothetical protein
MKEPGHKADGAQEAETDRVRSSIFSSAKISSARISAGELGWSAARRVTSALEAARAGLGQVAGLTKKRVARAGGDLSDMSEDVRAYLDPGVWLEDVYAKLGIATTARVEEIDDKIDRVELEMDQVARQRAREELLLVQQRIAELERVLRGVRGAENSRTRDAMGTLLGRLSKLETRIDSLPMKRFDTGAN